jgi:hypothetical protein
VAEVRLRTPVPERRGPASALSPPPMSAPTSAPSPPASGIVENVVAFEIAAAVEKYLGTSLAAIKAAHEAIHDLAKKHLEEWEIDKKR